eukprot:1137481-Pelagomonas_calceolata.AAC.1
MQKAVRSALVVMCGIEGYPWRLLRGGFSSDGHVSIDICLESVCGSVRASVEADGGSVNVVCCMCSLWQRTRMNSGEPTH